MLRRPLFRARFVTALATVPLATVALTVSSEANAQPTTVTAPVTAPPEADKPAQPQPQESRDPFDRHLAVGGYGVAWAGAYPAAGVGGRLRYEWPHTFGVEGFADHLAVQWPSGGIRHDHPIGFNIYMPFQISRSVRLRPLLGMCAVFSFIEPEHSGGPRADDILFGLHGGLGMEVALERNWSFFMEAQAIGYLAHDRSSQNWTGSVSPGVSTVGVFQPNMGLQVHFL